ncbi:regulatory protein [Salmonella enterica subsp. enterica]|uniref:Regulatory protein n=1 Tax=Salmonella enterica I TaxID=59201 RepID=A0A3S4K2Q9_SALET|nr:regulatory protein [Salmonella enterica subsp. enterica]
MGSKGANKSFDYNLIKILDAVIFVRKCGYGGKKVRHYTGLPFLWR